MLSNRERMTMKSEGGQMDDQELVKNLDRVARNIEVALKTLGEGKEPINASAAQLPLAKQYLADLKRMTEEGTHVVMDVTEALQDAQGRMRELSQNWHGERSMQAMHDIFMENEARFIQIYTALSFQDLVAQRIAALCSTLDDVEQKLVTVIKLFGVQTEAAVTGMDKSQAGLMLQRLDSARNALTQLVVDDVFDQYKYSSEHE
jgi:chemotaxis protein CheZ